MKHPGVGLVLTCNVVPIGLRQLALSRVNASLSDFRLTSSGLQAGVIDVADRRQVEQLESGALAATFESRIITLLSRVMARPGRRIIAWCATGSGAEFMPSRWLPKCGCFARAVR